MVKLADLAAGAYWETTGLRLGGGEPPELIMEIREPVLQVYGKVHGGAVAGLIDSAIAVAVNSELPPEKGAATVELKLNFLRPAAVGILRARGELLSKGKLLLVGEGRAWDEDGHLVAVGIATFRTFDMK